MGGSYNRPAGGMRGRGAGEDNFWKQTFINPICHGIQFKLQSKR